jgi:tRNA U34 5-methylaminomethyl-2-thiouridine-forming methyltransferase MnmC
MHVFINAGLQPLLNRKEAIHVFEMGFGTGLNALLTLQQALKNRQKILYTCIELYPLEAGMHAQLNYPEHLQDASLQAYFDKMHGCNWEENISIHPLFAFQKSNISLIDFSSNQPFDLVYFDAFDPAVQPELWTEKIFKQLLYMLSPGGILVTYSSKGTVRRAMMAAGFAVEKLKGPTGKREIVRAIKYNRD